MTTLIPESPCTVLRATCRKVFKPNVFAFERDAYLYLVDQAEGLTDAQRIELEQLAKSPDREGFWMLFNQCVSPITTYRIETHNLQLQPNLFKA
jgi:hypothetical protein